MICFPLDNTSYEANALGAWCGTRTRGVFAADTHYAVTSNDNMTVTVSPGLAWLKADAYWGVNAFEDTAQVLAIGTADGALARVDAVCLRLDKNQNYAELVIKRGAYSPQPPAITDPVRDIDYDELYVATIMVRAGATSIQAGDITDQRLNEEYCGIMRDGVTGIPTQQLYEQWAGWMSSITAESQQAYDAFVAAMAAYEAGAKQQFDAWFASLQDILDENTAAHLLNLIQQHEANHDNPHQVTAAQIGAASAQDVQAALATKQPALTAITVTLQGGAANWPGNRQTVAVPGVAGDDNIIWVSPAPDTHQQYVDAGIRLIEIGDGVLVFSCDDAPDTDVTANIAIGKVVGA